MHTRKLILLLLIFFKVSTSYAQNFSMNEHQINLLDRSQFEKKINGKDISLYVLSNQNGLVSEITSIRLIY